MTTPGGAALWRAPEVVLLLLLGACCLAGGSPVALDPGAVLLPPSSHHWLGTDSLGRDLLARLLEGGRTSLGIALGAAALSALLGGVLGLLAALARGWIDFLLGRLIEIADSLPTLLLALAAVATGRGRGALPLIGILALTRWTDVARLTRAEALAWRTSRLDGARAGGAGSGRLIVSHLLPASLPMLGTTAVLVAVEALEVEAGLGLVGLGIAPPAATWGNLLMEARLTLDEAWWTALFPGAAIFVTVLGLLGAAGRLDASRLPGQSGVERRVPPSPAGR